MPLRAGSNSDKKVYQSFLYNDFSIIQRNRINYFKISKIIIIIKKDVDYTRETPIR